MTQVVVLAAGIGKRMGGQIPKVLEHIADKPMISHLIEAIQKSGVCDKPLVVIESEESLVKKQLGDSCSYVVQKERLGTGHAVKMCEKKLETLGADHILVLYGDMPFVSSETILHLATMHEKSKAVLTMATVIVPHFEDEYQSFFDFGRVIRNEKEEIQSIVEKQDATPQELEIHEVNPSFFCFEARWLWEHIEKIKNNNAQKEFYLVDLVKIVFREDRPIASFPILDPFEAIGVNTKHQLEVAKKMFGVSAQK